MNKHFRVPGSLATRLEEVGISVSAVLRRAGLPAGLFQQTRILVNTEEFFALWKAVGEVSDEPAIGLKLGTETKTERFHPSAIAAISTESFGAAVACIARYKRLTCPEELEHQMHGNEWKLRFRWLLAMDNEPHALVDYCFAYVQSIARHGSSTAISPLRVEIVQPRVNMKHFERHFGCEIITGAPQNVIVYREIDASCPFVTRNAELLDLLAPQFENELKQSALEPTFSDQVRDAIQQRLTGHRPNVDDIARDLHLSSRTLQRRLQEHGSSYQRVLDEARHQMARYYLGNSLLELNEAAYLLGYEDTNSFTRAFRSWEGIPPSQWREANSAVALN